MLWCWLPVWWLFLINSNQLELSTIKKSTFTQKSTVVKLNKKLTDSPHKQCLLHRGKKKINTKFRNYFSELQNIKIWKLEHWLDFLSATDTWNLHLLQLHHFIIYLREIYCVKNKFFNKIKVLLKYSIKSNFICNIMPQG